MSNSFFKNPISTNMIMLQHTLAIVKHYIISILQLQLKFRDDCLCMIKVKEVRYDKSASADKDVSGIGRKSGFAAVGHRGVGCT